MEIDEDELRTMVGAMLGGLLNVDQPRSPAGRQAKKMLVEWMIKPETGAWIEKWQHWYSDKPAVEPAKLTVIEQGLLKRLGPLLRAAGDYRAKMIDSGVKLDWDAMNKVENETMEALNRINDEACAAKTLIGRLYFEGRGDGHAQYVVTAVHPGGYIQLGWIPFGDAWEAPWISRLGGRVPVQGLGFVPSSKDDPFRKTS